MEDFVHSMEYIYDNTHDSDRLIRDMISAEAARYASELVTTLSFKDLFKSHGELAFDIFEASTKIPSRTPVPRIRVISKHASLLDRVFLSCL